MEPAGLTPRARARIQYHIERLGSRTKAVAVRAENNLIRHYGARALPQLIEATRSRSSQVRLRAGWVLGTTQDPRAFETLVALTRDRNERVRYDSRIALGMLGDPRATPILIDLDLNDPLDYGASAMGLVRLYPACHDAVIDLARSGDPAKQSLAAYVLDLSETAEPSAFDALSRLIDTPDEDDRDRVIGALSRWRDGPAQELAARCLNHWCPVIRGGAVKWLAAADGAGARWLPLIEAALGDPVAGVRYEACAALAGDYGDALGHERLADALATMLADEAEGVAREALLGIFHHFQQAQYLRIVAAALTGRDQATADRLRSTMQFFADSFLERRATAKLLACVAAAGAPAYLPTVAARLQDESPSVRRAAARAHAILAGRRER